MNISRDCGSLSWELTRVLAPTLDAIVMLIGLVGHSLVIYVLTGKRRKNGLQSLQGTDMLLLTLSASDLLLLICLPFHTAAIALGYWPFSNILCKVISFLGVACKLGERIHSSCISCNTLPDCGVPHLDVSLPNAPLAAGYCDSHVGASRGSCCTSVRFPPIEDCAHPLLCVSIRTQPVSLQYHSVPVQLCFPSDHHRRHVHQTLQLPAKDATAKDRVTTGALPEPGDQDVDPVGVSLHHLLVAILRPHVLAHRYQ